MADKKMTDLDDLGTGIDQLDIFHVVDDPGGSPINKQVSVKNLFGNLKYVTSDSGGDTASGREFVRATLNVGTTSATSGDTTSFTSQTEHKKDSGDAVQVANIYGAKTKLTVTGPKATATGLVAGQYVNLDLTNQAGDSSGITGKVYGLVVDITDSSATDRSHKPNAFISLRDSYNTDAAYGFTAGVSEEALVYSVSHLVDLGGSASDNMVNLTSNGHAWDAGHGLMIAANGSFDATAESKIRISVNGTDYFLLATSNGHYEV